MFKYIEHNGQGGGDIGGHEITLSVASCLIIVVCTMFYISTTSISKSYMQSQSLMQNDISAWCIKIETGTDLPNIACESASRDVTVGNPDRLALRLSAPCICTLVCAVL